MSQLFFSPVVTCFTVLLDIQKFISVQKPMFSLIFFRIFKLRQALPIPKANKQSVLHIERLSGGHQF